MRKRHLLALMAAALAAPESVFADDVRRIPLNQAFRYLDSYLALAPSLRSRFYLVFLALRNERPAPDLKAAIVAPNGARIPLTLDARGQVEQLPSLPELKSDAVLEVDCSGKFRFATEMRPDVPPSTTIDAPSLRQALAQADAAISHLAGAFTMFVPKFAAVFPDAGSGKAVLASGRTAALPLTDAIKVFGPTPYYQPRALPGATVLDLARRPSRILFAQLPGS